MIAFLILTEILQDAPPIDIPPWLDILVLDVAAGAVDVALPCIIPVIVLDMLAVSTTLGLQLELQ